RSTGSFAKTISFQKRSVYRYGRLGSFADRDGDEQHVTRNVARDIDACHAVSSVSGSVTTTPFSPRLQPRVFDRSEAWWHPVKKNMPGSASTFPLSKPSAESLPSYARR